MKRAHFGIIGGLGCAVLVALFGPGLLLGGMLVAGSQRTIYGRARSPDGWHEARVQFDDGGALSGFERLVWVKHSWNLSDEPLLSCRAFWADGQAKIGLIWRDSSTLVIDHHVAPKNIREIASHCGPIRIVARSTQPFETF